MVPNRPDTNEAEARTSGQVLQFQQRRRVPQRPPRGTRATPGDPESEPKDDFAQFEHDEGNVNDRHRMLMNILAIGIVTLLIGVGVWLADTIADMERNQDCVMQGLNNCSPLEVPVPSNHQ